MTKNIEICKAEEVGAQVLDIRTTAERQAVAAINAAFGLSIPLPANEPGEITELPAAVSAHDRQLLAQTLGKPEPAATLSTTDPLATFVATLTRELYRHLAARQAVYPLADFPDLFARNLAHLLQAVQSLSPRKISNGSATNDGIPDGVSLAHILGSANSVTEIIDDNAPWGALRDISWLSLFPNLKKLSLNCETVNFRIFDGATQIEEFAMPYLKQSTYYGGLFYNSFKATTELNFQSLNYVTFGSNFTPCISGCAMKKFTADNLEILRSTGTNSPTFYNCPNLEEIHLKNLRYCNHWGITTEGGGLAYQCANLRKVVVGDLSYGTISGTSGTSANGMGFSGCPKLVDIEVGANGVDVSVSMDMRWWNPTYSLENELTTFLQNFRDHIALRLTDQGSGLTLTLSQAVRNAIHAAESTYGIEDIIVNQKHWTLSPAPSA